MSNFLAIATVTATLRRLLQSAIDQDLAGAVVTTTHPSAGATATPQRGVVVFLYQVTPNAAWRNAALPTRRSGDALLTVRPRAALDLHYLMIFYGDENELEPQRLLGSVIRTLHARSVLTRQLIRDTVTNPTTPFLATSNLAEEVELVKFTPVVMSLEELSKLWSVFFETPYALSVAYQGTVVLIDADETPIAPLPVRQRNVYAIPLRSPVIESLQADSGRSDPIVFGDALLLQGKQFSSDDTRVRISGQAPGGWQEVVPTSISDVEVRVPLTDASLRAGIRGVQVFQPVAMGTPPTPHGGFESNLAAFVLRPVVDKDPATGASAITVANVQVNPDGTRSADVTVTLRPAIGRLQSASLLLNPLDARASPPGYAFPAPPRESDPSTALVFPVSGAIAGRYLVRVQVDRAETVPDLDATSPTFGPTVTL
jgi:hypothetical protein